MLCKKLFMISEVIMKKNIQQIIKQMVTKIIDFINGKLTTLSVIQLCKLTETSMYLHKTYKAYQPVTLFDCSANICLAIAILTQLV